MMRQLGGSFGIAIITTLIHLRQGYHRVNLVEHVNPYNPAFQERLNTLSQGFASKGFSTEQAQTFAYKAIEGTVIRQTYLMSYVDAFWFVGIFFIFCIPLLYLQKMKRGSAPVVTDAH